MFKAPFLLVENFKSFLFAGRAVFSLKSKETGKHFTYKVRAAPDAENLWYVHYLIGSKSWRYLGTIFPEGFKTTRKTPVFMIGHPALKGFEWLYKHIQAGKLPHGAEVFHEGKCGMCGRSLTDPISVSEGFGPECRQKRLQRDFRSDNISS